MIVKIFTVSILCIYLLIMLVDILKKNGDKYLIFDDSVNENKGLLKKYAEVWDGIKYEIKTINGAKKMITEKIT